MDIYERSLARHRETRGKIEVASRMRLETVDDLSLAYTPGVARPCEVIAEDPRAAWDLTWKGRTVAVVSDGSAVLGLGDLGPVASLPVMEGKAALFREIAGVDAVPIVLDCRSVDEIVGVVRAIAPTFGGINLEDFSAPRCFEIEDRLQDVGVPVLHDDQHGTAIVVAAALRNAVRVVGKRLEDLRVVMVGAGAAGRAITRRLVASGVRDLLISDSKGLLWPGRPGQDPIKEELARMTNAAGRQGSLREILDGADVFVGVSRGGVLGGDDVRRMGDAPIILALANPTPEIEPDVARAAGAAVVATGRSDHPNQVNNVLAFPGLFRGALQARATRFTDGMKEAAIAAIEVCVPEPTAERILPAPLDRSVAVTVGDAVAAAAKAEGVSVPPEFL